MNQKVTDWEYKSLGSLCELINGFAFKPDDWGADGKPIIRIQNLNGGIDFNCYVGVIDPKYEVESGTLLFAWSGNRGTSFGPFVWLGPIGLLNQHIFKVIPSQELNSRWFYYALDEIRQKVERDAHGASGLVHVRKSDLIKYTIALPTDFDEQTKIAEILSTIDRAIEKTEALIAKQQRIKTGLMHDLLTRGIDEHGNLRSEQIHQFKDSPLGRIPVEWEVKFLEQLTLRIVDGVHHTPTYVESGIPFIVITDLTGSSDISFSNTRFVSERDHHEFSKRASPKPGDVLVTKDGTLGVARIVPEDAPEFSIFVSVAMLRPKQNVCLPELIWAFFESGEFLIQLGALSAGTGLAHIHLEHFRSFLVRCPPIGEQELIFCVINKQQDFLNSTISGLHKLKKQKTALMQDLFTGKKRVTPLLDPEATP